MGVHWTVEVLSLLLTALGAYVAFGPYHDDRTWNLLRNSAKIETIPVPSQEPTHFSLYSLAERSTSKPSLLFIPGHAGSWRQGINLCAYLEGAWNFYVTDFHASASALHWSVLSDQAAFTAAAIHHLGEHGGSRLTLLGHSMGGRVALEALKTSRRHVNALILISTPVGPHPLLLDPRFAPEAYDLQGLDVYSLSGGATDPLVPMKSCRERSLRFIPLPAASNVYSSFSHVNLLFSRHSLHFLARVLRASSLKGEGFLSPWLRLNSFTESTPAVQPKVLDNISVMDPVKVTSLASPELVEGKMRLWKRPKKGGMFSFLLLEEPRPIRRRPESTTRGETFEATDTLNCSEISLAWRQQDTEQWHAVPFMDMQFPAKVCLFQLRQRSVVETEVMLLAPALPKRLTPQRRSWAHWHADFLQATVNCSATLPGLLGWFTTLLWPLRCELPAGRALMTRVVLPLPQVPILPLDFRLSQVSLSEEQKNATLWPLILVSQAEREEDARIAALRLQTTPASSSWTSESRPQWEVFAPRFVGFVEEAYSIFVIGHPELHITLEVQGNIYSALAEFLRTQRFHNWLGACTCFSARDLSNSRFARQSFPVFWTICTVLLQLLTEASTSPLIAAKVLDALVALGLASASRRFALFVSAVCRPRNRGGTISALTMAVILLMASIQPAGCMLLLIIACVVQCGATKASPLLGTSSLLLGPYLLCQLPSMIFAVWLLLGQQKEASAPFLQSKLDRALPSSQHVPTLWADSWLSKDPDLRPVLSLLAPSVTLCCCMAKGPSSAPHCAEWGMLILSVAVTLCAASSLWWACQPVFLAQMLTALASSPNQAKED